MIIYRLLHPVCILSFEVCSVLKFFVSEGLTGTTDLTVVDLSPYGLEFKELLLQSLTLNGFLSFLFFVFFVTNHLHTPQLFHNHNAQTLSMGGLVQHSCGGTIYTQPYLKPCFG